jgi:hypothetical protein
MLYRPCEIPTEVATSHWLRFDARRNNFIRIIVVLPVVIHHKVSKISGATRKLDFASSFFATSARVVDHGG